MSAQIGRIARGWVGTPYRHMAARKGAGCDCLGLVRGVWAERRGEAPVPVPPYSADWRVGGHDLDAALAEVLARHEGAPRAGLVAVFRLRRGLAPRHCGILVSPDRFVHAQEGLGVVEARLEGSWGRRLAGLFAFPEE